MCGIAGTASTLTPDPDLVRRMCDVIVHRGPDGAGYHHDQHASLGMRRLAVIDVATGDQPVRNEDDTVVAVFNGEIYNYPELRRELAAKGHRFRGQGDSETLAHLYEEHGDDLVHRLRGMFAFAIWDRARRRLLLARDRVGKKPLYWRADGTAIHFASELKSLAQDPRMSRDIDLDALHHYLTYLYVPAPLSIYEGVRKLPPAHLLVWEDGEVTVRRYWQPDRTVRGPVDEREAEERTRELLLEATRIRMVSDRPVGAFLSGGIDSSAVVAAMAMQSSERVKTFSIGFEDSRYDERSKARMVAERYGTDHHEMVVDAGMLDILPRLAWHFDEPFADSSAIPSFYVAQLSRRHVTVALNGDGGDECFGGYQRYALVNQAGRIPPLPRHLAAMSARVGDLITRRSGFRSLPRRIGRLMQFAAEPPSRRYATLMSCFKSEQKTELYCDPLRERLAGTDSRLLLEKIFRGSSASTDLGRILDVDLMSYLPGDLLVKVDISTMANSLEARSPFLDHHLLEWAATLPTGLLVRGGRTKMLLKRAVAPWLPAELLHLPKQGFGVPLAAWLRGELRDLAHDALTDDTARGRGLFRPEVVSRLLRQHAAGADHSARLWALLQFELWHRAHAAPRELVGAEAHCPRPGA
ncbi:asparagine synthase (glutamine-hydrolyzing) [Microbispora bryophytorum]|uniref:asparagine synthase (glutamine-hydrolyzing) n=1 Tax=Microbispora bryophytorum TaxID=1460882 RepID=A0A8H9H355_9ACTN|nr:asparagine synthase (glutamine-hydrolyzing) [Microbispora bryophytorum]MBD3139473.1 asparagine synthase (glutamine-hydrolyzing) [Microbispora bryophytorum]TQS04466.1 asparagine synthase (glutamine-hydrolyzing) [Microbispora bryophytorum]GGO23671.1 asparagine synthetase B [Microbispora bryophytorum]